MVLDAGMDCHAGSYVSGVVTAPGEDVLPWACSLSHRHSGKLGCRCDDDALAEWDSDRDERWSRLLDAAQRATLRTMGKRAPIIVRIFEPQARGAWHVHLSVSAKTDPDKLVARHFFQELDRLASVHGFGDVLGYGLRDRAGQQNRKVYGNARSLSRYLRAYFVGKGENGKAALLETMRHAARVPPRLIWISPKLTTRSGVTMRVLRLARRFKAARRGLIDYPPIHTYTRKEAATVWKLLGGFGGFQLARAARAP